MKKWITPILIVVGAVLLFGASGLDAGKTNSFTVGFKIIGLLAIFLGIYRATKVVRSHTGKLDSDDKEGRSS